ncbi:VTC domain-containing protein [Candidatus Latescibacterota bacterium]
MKYDVAKMKYEYKYCIPNEQLPEIRKRISPFLEHDSNMKFGGTEGYTVRSIYFDTPRYDFYHEKIEGLKQRKKLRIRGYNEYNQNNIVYLEIKKKNEKRIYKNRAAVPYCDLEKLLMTGDIEKYILSDDGSKIPVENAQRFLFNIHKLTLLPAVLVIYEREAFQGKFDHSLRITFDKNLRSAIYPCLGNLYKEENINYTIPNHSVLEVKFYHVFPSFLSKIIESMELRLQAFSKYTKCIDEHIVVRTNTQRLKYDYLQSIHF